jgi:PEP-CTERM motif
MSVLSAHCGVDNGKSQNGKEAFCRRRAARQRCVVGIWRKSAQHNNQRRGIPDLPTHLYYASYRQQPAQSFSYDLLRSDRLIYCFDYRRRHSSLLTDTIAVNSTGAGTLFIWVTESGLTSPLGEVNYISGLTSNLLVGGISSVTLSTFVSPTDGVSPPNGTLLDTATFTGLGTETLSSVLNPGPGPYSLQELFVIHATGVGATNLTIDLTSSTVPEPSTWAMMLLGFAGLAYAGFRRAKADRATIPRAIG